MYVTSIRMWKSSEQKITAMSSKFLTVSLCWEVEVKALLFLLKIFLTFVKAMTDLYHLPRDLELNFLLFFNLKKWQ